MNTPRRILGGLLAALLLLQTALAMPVPCGLMQATGIAQADGSCCCAVMDAPTAPASCCDEQAPPSSGPAVRPAGCGCQVAPLPDPEPARPTVIGESTAGLKRLIQVRAHRCAHTLASPFPCAGSPDPARDAAATAGHLTAPPRLCLTPFGSRPLADLAAASGGAWAQRVLCTARL